MSTFCSCFRSALFSIPKGNILISLFGFFRQITILYHINHHHHRHYHCHHGLPAHSHHDKIQPWWEYVSNEHGGILSRYIPPMIIFYFFSNSIKDFHFFSSMWKALYEEKKGFQNSVNDGAGHRQQCC